VSAPATEPRALDVAQLAGAAEDGEDCPACQAPPVAGTHRLDGRGPYQLISTYSYECADEHMWRRETDGG